jgi:integrase
MTDIRAGIEQACNRFMPLFGKSARVSTHHPPHYGDTSVAGRRRISVIALWLGHESPTTTHHYVEANLTMKERALAKLHEPEAKIQHYRAPDSLINFLKTL